MKIFLTKDLRLMKDTIKWIIMKVMSISLTKQKIQLT
jgi:hypothetical protein